MIEASRRSIRAERPGLPLAAAAAFVAAALVAGCGGTPAKFKPTDEAGPHGVWWVPPQSGNPGAGIISFTPPGKRRVIARKFEPLDTGPPRRETQSWGQCTPPNLHT